jgi:Domain of unknown function (DUF4357)
MIDEFTIKTVSGVQATMIVVEGKFVVKAGSTANKDTDAEMTSYVNLKKRLIREGSLVLMKDHYLFSKDTVFKSVSGAAAVVLDRNANGNKEWRHAQTRVTFGDWKDDREASTDRA